VFSYYISFVSIVTRGCELDDLGFIPGRSRDFSLRHRVQTDSGVHSTSYPMCIGGSFPGLKAAGA
jgi:hypothetical protein